eukprot:jgi/Tetstr1/453667/TSEL_040623.t1
MAFFNRLKEDVILRDKTLLLQSSSLAVDESLQALVVQWLSTDSSSSTFPSQSAVTHAAGTAQLTATGPVAPRRHLHDETATLRRSYADAEPRCKQRIDRILEQITSAGESKNEKRQGIYQLQFLSSVEVGRMPAVVRRLYQRHLRGTAAGQLAHHAKDLLHSLTNLEASEAGSALLSSAEHEPIVVEIADCADALMSLGKDFHERHVLWKRWGGVIFPLVLGLIRSCLPPLACRGLLMAQQMLKADYQRYGLRFQEEDRRSSQQDAPIAWMIFDALLRLLSPACQPQSIIEAAQQQGASGEQNGALSYLKNLQALCSVRMKHFNSGEEMVALQRALRLLLRGSPYHCRSVSVQGAQKLISAAAHLAIELKQYALASEILGCLSQLLSCGRTEVISSIANNRELVGVATVCFEHLCIPEANGNPDLAYELLGRLVLAKQTIRYGDVYAEETAVKDPPRPAHDQSVNGSGVANGNGLCNGEPQCGHHAGVASISLGVTVAETAGVGGEHSEHVC